MADEKPKNVYSLPASETFSPAQALASAASLEPTEVIVVGFDKDGELLIRSSRMTREQALWILVKAQKWALGELED